MLFLLREIRNNLLRENKFKSYILYAIGEIFLVVIGILIAVSLNNLNNDRIEKKKIGVLLEQMTQELDDQIVFYQEDSIVLQSYVTYLFKASEKQFDQIDLTAFLTPFGTWMGGSKNFDTALNGLINQGIFDKIGNTVLKKVILKDYLESQNEINQAFKWNLEVITTTIEPFINENFAYKYRNGDLIITESQVLSLYESSTKFRTMIEFQLLVDDFALTNITNHLVILRIVKRELDNELAIR